jgi:RNA polymerase sigma-70 factor, ECF subfamily
MRRQNVSPHKKCPANERRHTLNIFAPTGLYSTMRLETVEAARTGGVQEVDALICDIWPHAFRIALTVLHDSALAEDAAQEACAIVYAQIKRLRDKAAFKVWFYRIVVREASFIRRRAQRAWSAQSLPAEPADVERAAVRLDVVAALAKLSPVQRTATVLYFYAGLSGAEIAEVLGIPHGTVRFHLFRARKRLERLLDTGADTTPFEGILLDAI